MNDDLNIKNYVKKEKFEIVREVLISIIISSLVLTIFTFYSNKKIDSRIAERQFIYDFGRTFVDTPKYRDIRVAIEENYLYGKDFVNKNAEKFSDYDIDDYLYLLYDIWAFHKQSFISKELLDNQYSYFFCITYNSPEIIKYREKLRKEGFDNAHNFLDELAEEFDLVGRNCREL